MIMAEIAARHFTRGGFYYQYSGQQDQYQQQNYSEYQQNSGPTLDDVYKVLGSNGK